MYLVAFHVEAIHVTRSTMFTYHILCLMLQRERFHMRVILQARMQYFDHGMGRQSTVDLEFFQIAHVHWKVKQKIEV